MLTRCALIRQPLEFVRAGRVLDVMRTVTNGWALRPVGDDAGVPLLSVAGGWRGYTIAEAGKRDILERTAVSAACTAIMVLLNRMIETRANYLCLHAGAARIGEEAIVFPSTHRAGKSTLVSGLAFRGWRVVAEDILPIDCSGERTLGAAAGVAPRLRRPVGHALGKDFRRAVARHAGRRDRWLRYVALPPGRLDSYGRTSAIGAFVFLDRQDGPGFTPSLSAVAKGSAMETILRQNFGTAAPPTEIVDRVAAMADDAACLRLSYHHLDDALRLLDDAFGEGRSGGKGRSGAPSDTTVTCAPSGRAPLARGIARHGRGRLSPATRLRARSDIIVRDEGGVAFLMDEANGTIFSLDALGLGIWKLLEEARTLHELVAIVAEAQPDIAPARIEADIAALLGALAEAGLADDSGPTTAPANRRPT